MSVGLLAPVCGYALCLRLPVKMVCYYLFLFVVVFVSCVVIALLESGQLTKIGVNDIAKNK